MPDRVRGFAQGRPVHVQPTSSTGGQHHAAPPVRPHVYRRRTPQGRRVTIVSVDALAADERARIAEAAGRTEASGRQPHGGGLRVEVSASLGVDAVYVEGLEAPLLALRSGQSPEAAVSAVAHCLPTIPPDEARRLVELHLPNVGAPDATTQLRADSTFGTARTKPGRLRKAFVGAFVGAAAVATGVIVNATDGVSPTEPSANAEGRAAKLDRSQSRSVDERPAGSTESAAATVVAPTPATSDTEESATDPSSEPDPAESTPIDDALTEETATTQSSEETASGSASADGEEPENTSVDSTTATTTPTTPSEPTAPTGPTQEQDEPDQPDGFLGTLVELFR